jgi:hypothetical protein
MHRRIITTYAMLPRGATSAPPPPPLPPPQELAPSQGNEEEDSDDEEFFTDLPTDTESEEAAAEQRAILMSFETWHRDQSVQEFMAIERRAAAAKLTDKHAAARTDT